MSEKKFSIARALAALGSQKLLGGVHLPGGEFLPAGSEGEASALTGSFLGAGLDNRNLARDQLFVALAGEQTDGRLFAPAALKAGHWVLTRTVDGKDDLAGLPSTAGVMLSPDPEAALAVLAGVWREEFDLPVVGITGSNGKTTTKDFLTALLSAAGSTCATLGNLNNRLGLPLTLLGLRPEHRFAVVEMGASAVGHIAHLAAMARPTIALITNAGQAHLAEFGSLAGVIEGKGEILDALPSDGRAVLNADSPGFQQWVDRAPCPVVSFGQTEGDHLWAWRPAGSGTGPAIILDGESWPVPLPGPHNGANLAAAILAARLVGLGDGEIRRGLERFRPSEHRSLVLAMAGRTILDDAYNANPASMLAAAKTVAQLPGTGKVLAVLGHMAELGETSEELHRQTGSDLAVGQLDTLLAVGEQARPLVAGFVQAGGLGLWCSTIEEAAAWLVENSRPGDRIVVKGSRSAGMERLLPLLELGWEKKESLE